MLQRIGDDGRVGDYGCVPVRRIDRVYADDLAGRMGADDAGRLARCRLVACQLEHDWVRKLAAIARNGDGEAVTAGWFRARAQHFAALTLLQVAAIAGDDRGGRRRNRAGPCTCHRKSPR